MSEGRTNEEFLSDCWIGLTSWEQQICEDLEGEDETQNQRMVDENDAAHKKLWFLFQNAAQCVAVMYKGATDQQQQSLWVPFQTAAGNVTSLYKESMECIRKCTETGSQSGYHKRNRELANWARRRRHIRRDELLAFLSGKSPPPRNNHLRGSPRTRLSLDRMSPRHPTSHQGHNHHQHGHEDNLNMFREALGMPAPPAVTSPSLSSRRRNSSHSPELQSFICDEFARNKRPAPSNSPSHDVTMDSPQHKRFKLT